MISLVSSSDLTSNYKEFSLANNLNVLTTISQNNLYIWLQN